MPNIVMYSDGSARGNPDGPGGYGTRIEFIDESGQKFVKELSQGYQRTTNNRMELMGAIAGLEALNQPCTVTLYSDSQYVIKAFNDHWIDGWLKKNWKTAGGKPVKNVDLWKRLIAAVGKHDVTFVWVKGHADNPGNERCDELATTAADGDDLLVDEGLNA